MSSMVPMDIKISVSANRSNNLPERLKRIALRGDVLLTVNSFGVDFMRTGDQRAIF